MSFTRVDILFISGVVKSVWFCDRRVCMFRVVFVWMAYNQEWRVQGSRVSDDHMCYLIANFDNIFFLFFLLSSTLIFTFPCLGWTPTYNTVRSPHFALGCAILPTSRSWS